MSASPTFLHQTLEPDSQVIHSVTEYANGGLTEILVLLFKGRFQLKRIFEERLIDLGEFAVSRNARFLSYQRDTTNPLRNMILVISPNGLCQVFRFGDNRLDHVRDLKFPNHSIPSEDWIIFPSKLMRGLSFSLIAKNGILISIDLETETFFKEELDLDGNVLGAEVTGINEIAILHKPSLRKPMLSFFAFDPDTHRCTILKSLFLGDHVSSLRKVRNFPGIFLWCPFFVYYYMKNRNKPQIIQGNFPTLLISTIGLREGENDLVICGKGGKLYWGSMQQNEDEIQVQFTYIGITSIASSVLLLNDHKVFISSVYGPSTFAKIELGALFGQRNTLIRYNQPGCSPINDMVLIQEENKRRIVIASGVGAACGRLKFGSDDVTLRLNVKFLMKEMKSMFSLQLSDAENDTYVLISHTTRSSFLRWNDQRVERFQSDSITKYSTILAVNFTKHQAFVQVTQHCVKWFRYLQANEQFYMTDSWKCDIGSIDYAVFTADDNVLAVASGQSLKVLAIDPDNKKHKFSILLSHDFELEVVSVTWINQWTNFDDSVGKNKHILVALRNQPDVVAFNIATSSMTTIVTLPAGSNPKSMLSTDDCLMIVVESGDILCYLNFDGNQYSSIYHWKNSVNIAPNLFLLQHSDKNRVVASGNSSFIIDVRNESVVFKKAPSMVCACTIPSERDPNLVATATAESINFGHFFEGLDELTQGVTVRKLVYQEETRAIAIVTQQHIGESSEERRRVTYLSNSRSFCRTPAHHLKTLSENRPYLVENCLVILNVTDMDPLYCHAFAPYEVPSTLITGNLDEKEVFVALTVTTYPSEQFISYGRIVVFQYQPDAERTEKFTVVASLFTQQTPQTAVCKGQQLFVTFQNHTKSYVLQREQLMEDSLRIEHGRIVDCDIGTAEQIVVAKSNTLDLLSRSAVSAEMVSSPIEISHGYHFNRCAQFNRTLIAGTTANSTTISIFSFQENVLTKIKSINVFSEPSIMISTEIIHNSPLVANSQVVYASKTGRIGIIMELSDRYVPLMQEVQNILKDSENFKVGIACDPTPVVRKTENVTIDGNLLEHFLKLGHQEKLTIMSTVDFQKYGEDGDLDSESFLNMLHDLSNSIRFLGPHSVESVMLGPV